MSDFLFNVAKRKVEDRGHPPDAFLSELLAWARTASDEIFALNTESGDIYGLLRPILWPWQGEPGSPEWVRHRKAALMEHMRVHAGFESSWKWGEGVDRTNKTSMAHIEGQETGIFQVSYDSLNLERGGKTLRDCIERFCGLHNIQRFIDTMKTNHAFALEYYARLVRISTRWAGPINRGETLKEFRREAVAEFQALLAP